MKEGGCTPGAGVGSWTVCLALMGTGVRPSMVVREDGLRPGRGLMRVCCMARLRSNMMVGSAEDFSDSITSSSSASSTAAAG